MTAIQKIDEVKDMEEEPEPEPELEIEIPEKKEEPEPEVEEEYDEETESEYEEEAPKKVGKYGKKPEREVRKEVSIALNKKATKRVDEAL